MSDLVDEGFLSSQIDGLGRPEDQEAFIASLIVWALDDKGLVARTLNMLAEAERDD